METGNGQNETAGVTTTETCGYFAVVMRRIEPPPAHRDCFVQHLAIVLSAASAGEHNAFDNSPLEDDINNKDRDG
jgi:hypothetical protein